MKKVKINEYCPVPPPYGGITVYVKRLSDQLRKDGFTVGGYYTKDCTDQNVINSPYYRETVETQSHSKIVRAFFQIYRLLMDAVNLNGYDVIHYHGLENLKFIWAINVLFKKQIIITVHSAMIEGFYKHTSTINKFFMRKLAESDVQWTAVSEQSRQCMLNLPFHFKNEIPVIAAYVPIEQKSDRPLKNEMYDYIKAHKKIIAFYGRSFMVNNGIDVYGFEDALTLYSKVVEHYGNSVGMVFCLSEDKDTDKIRMLLERAKQLKVQDKIYWQIGAIDNIFSLWKAIDIYIRPTSTDGDSVAVREVLDYGVQVVASDVCQRPDRVITYEWNNADSFFEKVKYALSLPKDEPNQDYRHYNAMKRVICQIVG